MPQITEKSVMDCNCPICCYPNLHANSDEQNMSYFSLLIASLKSVLDKNILRLFEKKLTERALASDPNFIWCILVSAYNKTDNYRSVDVLFFQCTSGFVKNEDTDAVQCLDCRVRFCFKCKRVVSKNEIRTEKFVQRNSQKQ